MLSAGFWRAGEISLMAFRGRKVREPMGVAELFEYAVRSLARRMRTERDLRRLLELRAEPGDAGTEAANAVIGRLRDLNYLSDERYAADFARLRKENQSFGRRRVQGELAARGIGKEHAEAALEKSYAEVDELELARQYCDRKRIQPPANDKEVARVMGRLMRAGFGSPAIWKLLRGWRVDVTEIEVEETSG